jgi:hypothetical protein
MIAEAFRIAVPEFANGIIERAESCVKDPSKNNLSTLSGFPTFRI